MNAGIKSISGGLNFIFGMSVFWFAACAVHLLSGCASTPWSKANCIRYRYKAYNVLACNDEAVGQHCFKHGKLADNGKPLDYLPRACMEHNMWGRKDTIVIGLSYMGCLPHELCHADGVLPGAECARLYPCAQDAK